MYSLHISATPTLIGVTLNKEDIPVLSKLHERGNDSAAFQDEVGNGVYAATGYEHLAIAVACAVSAIVHDKIKHFAMNMESN